MAAIVGTSGDGAQASLSQEVLFAQTEPEPITPEAALVQSAGHNRYAEG